MIVESVMIVPAFLMNDHPRSHMLLNTVPTVGRWYAGSSITNGAGSPTNNFVFFKMIPEQIIENIPRKYADGATHGAPSKIAPATIAMNGSLAPQGINVVVIIVILRSLSFSIVRESENVMYTARFTPIKQVLRKSRKSSQKVSSLQVDQTAVMSRIPLLIQRRFLNWVSRSWVSAMVPSL